MTHLVFASYVMPLIDTPQFGVSGKYIVAHELSHVHEHYLRDLMLPNTMLRATITARDEAVLFDTADACWGEHFACRSSASIHPDQAKLFEMPLIQLLRGASGEIVRAKRDWILDRDFGRVWRRVGQTALSLLKYFSYLLGHAAGLQKSPNDLAPEVWNLLGSNGWLAPWIPKLGEALVAMFEALPNWKGLEVFEPLKQIARGVLEDCGIMVSDSGGSLYIFVREGKLPV